jgi:hypothetical protein
MCASPASTLPAKARPLVEYLRERVREEGNVYVKSRFVAEEIELSSKEIGSYMRRLREESTELRVEAWAYTNGTTWRVAAE